MMNTDDTTLIARCRKGDDAAFEILYNRYRLQLYGYLNHLLSSRRDLVEDIFQQVWIKASANWSRYDDRQRLFAWLCRIAHNLVMDFYRGDGKREFIELPETLMSDEESPAAHLSRSALEQALQKAIRSLPGPQRQVVELRTQGVSFNDIAKQLGTNLNTALGRMHYAVKALQKELADFL